MTDDRVRLVRVVVWPAADPKQRVHVAFEDRWQLDGLTLCQQPIKDKPTAEHELADDCPRCMQLVQRMDVNTPTGVVLESRLTPQR